MIRMNRPKQVDVLVIGGGIAGITTSLEASETGRKVVLVERNPYLGGRVTQMNKYFPKLCPPICGLEMNLRRIRSNPNIEVLTLSKIEKVQGKKGGYEVTIKQDPRFTNDNCTACGACERVCPVERSDEFNFGLTKTKAIYLPHQMSHPMQYVIDGNSCVKCGACVEACKYGAIDLEMEAKSQTIRVPSIVVATGWKPYDASRIDNLKYGVYKDIVTNMQFERMSAVNGPTNGKILRPSDNKEPERIVFVQCAGSRDENHLPYCSAVCCLASMKQATYIREQNPNSKVTIFYIDIRALGRYEDFYNKVSSDGNVTFIKGKVADITEDKDGLVVSAEDILSGKKTHQKADLVVLACGMVPEDKENLPILIDEYGFMIPGDIYPVGVAKRPMEVAGTTQDATAAALLAIQK
ncbi:MAG: CoB--CoM heterodisulfide reductase iron-sulfur subunit A family protein [bacterium]